MSRLNKDAVIAIFLLVASGILFWSTFSIRTPDYGVLSPAAWPRVIIIALTLLSFIYLFQSLKAGPSTAAADADRQPGIRGWFIYWQNPIYCFALFLAYLLTLPILGSLIGGLAFVFTLMCVLGGISGNKLILHAALSLVTVGGMWVIFTYGLGVILPPGIIFSAF
ncbi:MAG: tripartite tricarboxylate transporter TctB family protein [Rhodospirillales bacterium]|nr:tripartite tricarboxylate transporter TctB family protein [Rhodospirillales bacterium]